MIVRESACSPDRYKTRPIIIDRTLCTLQVYLEGDLERGIVPEESVWMHGGGTGEDGCLLLLRKMNLELLRRSA